MEKNENKDFTICNSIFVHGFFPLYFTFIEKPACILKSKFSTVLSRNCLIHSYFMKMLKVKVVLRFLFNSSSTLLPSKKKKCTKKLSDFHRSNLELERSYLLLKHARYNKCILYNYVSFLKWAINHVEIEINVKRYLEWKTGFLVFLSVLCYLFYCFRTRICVLENLSGGHFRARSISAAN